MPSLNRHLDRFERFAQRKIERPLRKAFASGVQLEDVAAALIRALEDALASGEQATEFEVKLQPDIFDPLETELREIEAGLASYLNELAREDASAVSNDLNVRLVREADQNEKIEVTVAYESEVGSSTRPYRVQRPSMDAHSLETLEAYLIVDGRRHVALDQHVVTLGRNVNCDIVVESPTVSRQHAQLRWRFGRFFVYDLGSKAGTRVNGRQVRESVLQPGDVIMISDVALIYAEGRLENGEPHDRHENDRDGSTQILNPDRFDEH